MKKCKHCKEKFNPVHFNQKFCFNEDCKKVWIETEHAKQWVKRKKELKEELETVQSLMKKAQKQVNTFIRERDKNKPCVSCGKPLKEKFDCGHYIASTFKIHTFRESNLHGQCVYCNQYLSANLIEYRKELIKRVGVEEVEYLEASKHLEANFTRQELKQLIEEYKQKVKQLKL